MVIEKKRYIWLDIARGICILLMVICHACGYSDNRWQYFNGITGIFFLVFFFVSAGFCFDDNRKTGEFVKRQFKKCLLPYLIVSFFYLAVMFHRGRIPGDGIIQKGFNGFASPIWGYSNSFTIGPLKTIGMGPIWFLVAFFFATVIYKLIGNKKYSAIVIIALALMAAVSQRWISLPFAVQVAFIGCMYIMIGNAFRKKWMFIIEKLQNASVLKLVMMCIGFTIITVILIMSLGYSGYRLTGKYLDLGSNSYSFFCLPASLTGCYAVVALSVLIEKTGIFDEFLAFCGLESFFILVLHDIDITMVRYWGGKDLYFMGFTLLAYPFFVYLFRRFEKEIRKFRKHE